MDSDEKRNDYEKDIIDVDEFTGAEIKVSPSYYLHLALIACQKAMTAENITESVLAYRMAVGHLESVAKAAKLLDEDYDKKLEEFKQSEDYKKDQKDHAKIFKLASCQYKLISEEIFSNQIFTSPMKF